MKTFDPAKLKGMMQGRNKDGLCITYRQLHEASKRVGFAIPLMTIQEHLRGTSVPSANRLAIYAEIFDVPMEDFFSGERG